MLRTAIYTVSATLVFASIAQADVYKYTDEKGNIQYTDRPLTLPAERLSVASQRSDVVALDERENEGAQSTDQDKPRQQTEKPTVQQKKPSQSAAEAKEQACTKAREDYVSRMTSQKLFSEEPNGQRTYLTTAEIDAARASAKLLMDTMCN